MSLRDGELAHHIRRLGNHELNELLLQLPKASFAALVEVALARPVLPAGLVLRFEPTPGVDGWTVVACAPRRRLGISRWQAYKLARSGRLPTTRLGARDLHVPAAVLRRIEQEGLPPAPEGGEVA